MTTPDWDLEYTLCAVQLCPFFVDPNASFSSSTPELPIARYLHLADQDHEDWDDHEPQPGIVRPLRWFHDHGPEHVRVRFVDHPPTKAETFGDISDERQWEWDREIDVLRDFIEERELDDELVIFARKTADLEAAEEAAERGELP